MAKNGVLSSNQRRALEALIATTSVRAAADKAGLGRRTLYRYLGDPAFKAELRKRQDAILSATTASLVGLTYLALDTLQTVLASATATDGARVRAALGWLSHVRQVVELRELIDRIEALEERWGNDEQRQYRT